MEVIVWCVIGIVYEWCIVGVCVVVCVGCFGVE